MSKEAYHARLTPEAIAAWRRMRDGEERRFSCISDEVPCDSTDPHVHCAPCLAYIEASKALDRALGLKPWEYVYDNEDLVAALDAALTRRQR